MHHLVSIFPRVLEYAVCLFLIPCVFYQLCWPLCFTVLFQEVCLQSLFVSACRMRALPRTYLDTHAGSSLDQVNRSKRSHIFMVAELLA